MMTQFEITLTNNILYYEELKVVLTNERVSRKLYFTNTNICHTHNFLLLKYACFLFGILSISQLKNIYRNDDNLTLFFRSPSIFYHL